MITHHIIAMGSIGAQELIVILLISVFTAVSYVLPVWIICRKCGLAPALSLIAVIPGGLIVLLFMIALMDWPALKATPSTSGGSNNVP